MIRRWFAFLVFCVALLTSNGAPSHGGDNPNGNAVQKKPDAKRPKNDATWTVDDVILAEEAGHMQISPDGRWALWVKRSPDKDKNEMVAHLMLSSLTEKKEIQLTRGGHGSTDPLWSPDGRLAAFLSSRPSPKTKRDDDEAGDGKEESKTQIWLINPFGGEPWGLTQSPRDVRHFAWADADTIIYVAQEKMGQLETKLKDKKDDAQAVDDELNEPPVRLWKIDIKEKKAERITDNSDRITSLTLSPDGHYAVTIHERSLSYEFDHKVKPAVFLYDLDKGTRKQIYQEAKYTIASIHWERDSKGFYALNHFTHHPRYVMAYIEEAHYYRLADGAMAQVNLAWERGLADTSERFAVTPEGFVALLADGVRHTPRRYVRKGLTWDAHPLDLKNLHSVRASRDGKTLLYLESTAATAPRWHHARCDNGVLKDSTVLTDLQADLRQRKRAKTDTVRWKGALGEEVEGLLSYPHDYKAGARYPLIVLIHGGPLGADNDEWDERWSYVRNLLCARGAFVFKPNYHGSSNYGLAFAESIADGKYYLPVEDIEKGIDALVARGLVEPKRVALGGWSNGAILTMALITRRDYQAASAGAGGSEWVADWGTCEFGMCFSNYYLGKSPLEDPEVYRKNSPFFDFAKVKTPTILFHGSEDRAVPSHHGWMQFRALQQLGKTDVRFLLFPGEKHGFKKLSHQRRKVEEELAWYDKYLFKTTKPTNLALKDESPLAQALALKKAAKQGRLYGVLEKGVLAPETIAYKDRRVGRFEVTRAQFAQFDKKYAIEPGSENYPAHGISFERAKEYCAWLKKATGRPYRLGTVEEMDPIYETAETPENTLDYWAGYSINPEDRRRLESAIKDLPGPAPLLKEVGSFRSADAKIAIFDLGGNVAEWADDDGKGKALGGSADVPAGERTQRSPAAPYIGLRVVCQEEEKSTN